MKFSKILVITTLVCTSSNVQAGFFTSMKNLFNSDQGKQVLTGLSSLNSTNSPLTNSEISSGLREALRVGVSNVVSKLGVEDGFNSDPAIHIPLPGNLAKVKSALALIGMSSMMEELELKFNRAAETATPKAKELFINAISQMSITDAKDILTGENDSATKYLRSTMGNDLVSSMQPIVSTAMESTGAIQSYNSALEKYSKIPFMPDVKANLNNYVVNKAMDGIFYYVGKEETSIRENPAARSTELLQKVFTQ